MTLSAIRVIRCGAKAEGLFSISGKPLYGIHMPVGGGAVHSIRSIHQREHSTLGQVFKLFLNKIVFTYC
jgi:hypothetical protein